MSNGACQLTSEQVLLACTSGCSQRTSGGYRVRAVSAYGSARGIGTGAAAVTRLASLPQCIRYHARVLPATFPGSRRYAELACCPAFTESLTLGTIRSNS
jgi:hypothetical protein